MMENYGIYCIANISNHGYDQVLQKGLKRKHLFNFEYGVFKFKKTFGQR